MLIVCNSLSSQCCLSSPLYETDWEKASLCLIINPQFLIWSLSTPWAPKMDLWGVHTSWNHYTKLGVHIVGYNFGSLQWTMPSSIHGCVFLTNIIQRKWLSDCQTVESSGSHMERPRGKTTENPWSKANSQHQWSAMWGRPSWNFQLPQCPADTRSSRRITCQCIQSWKLKLKK